MKKIVLVLLVASMAAACGGARKGSDASDGNAATGLKKFEMPEPPVTLTDPQLRADYMVERFWDKFDFTDTAYVHAPDITDQAFVDFISIAPYADPEKALAGVRRMMEGAGKEKKMLEHFLKLGEDYLYNPNYPMRNEEFYILMLESAIASDKLDDVEKIRPRAHLEIAMKNRIGDKGADIVYTTADGRKGRLYGIQTAYTILFINNPDCPACAQIIEEMKNSELLSQLLSSKQATVLAVYPDEDLEAWRNHRKDIPANWIYSYDAQLEMRNSNSYDLKAIPTLYLLDKGKTVLVKDAPDYLTIERYLLSSMM